MILKLLPEHLRKSLLSSDTSRQNKIWLAVGWKEMSEYFIEWRWASEYMRSRLEFKFEPDGEFVKAKSYDEDIFPKLKWMDQRKNKVNKDISTS